MKLEEMKRIANARTKGPWHWTKFDSIEGYEPYTDGSNGPGSRIKIIETDSRVYPPGDNDADFIIMVANNWDKIMAVVEAAKEFCDAYVIKIDESTERMIETLKSLEEE